MSGAEPTLDPPPLRFLGTLSVAGGGRGDAGSGRKVWLAANLDPADRVVDLGGTGGLFAGWHPPELVVGFDDLSGFGPGHRIDVPFRLGDVQAVSFPDDSFPVAVLTEVLEHLPDPVRAMREAARVAGRVLVTTPFEHAWRNGLAYQIAGHIRYYTVDTFAAQLRRANLHGDCALLVFDEWAFLVAVVADRGKPRPVDRLAPSGGAGA